MKLKNVNQIACVAILLFIAPNIFSQETETYSDSIVFKSKREIQTWLVPNKVMEIHVDAYGAQGGSENGGKGGRVESDLKVTPATTIYIKVGSQPESNEGGYNGGGKGCGTGTGGGGASDIRIGGTELKNRVLVAGGGGGMGYLGFAGAGGGLEGGNGGYDDSTEYHIAGGGTQEAGGAGARVYYSPAGKLGVGGDGVNSRGQCVNSAMGGGGGGYYGGGAGGAGGGGGGSSFTDKNNSNVVHHQGVQEGDGRVVIYWKKKK